MTKQEAWDYATSIIKCDKLKVSDQMNILIEQEINGEITLNDILNKLNEKYKKIGGKNE